jgi:serine/threonine protein kinase
LGRAVRDPREAFLLLLEGAATIDGRFTELRRMGEHGGDGHFSLLFTARDEQTGRRVAIKVFNPTMMDAYRLACFDREAQLLQDLAGERDIIALVAPRGDWVVPMPWGPGGATILSISLLCDGPCHGQCGGHDPAR